MAQAPDNKITLEPTLDMVSFDNKALNKLSTAQLMQRLKTYNLSIKGYRYQLMERWQIFKLKQSAGYFSKEIKFDIADNDYLKEIKNVFKSVFHSDFIDKSGLALDLRTNLSKIIAEYGVSIFLYCCDCWVKLGKIDCWRDFEIENGAKCIRNDNGHGVYWIYMYRNQGLQPESGLIENRYWKYDDLCIMCSKCMVKIRCDLCARQYVPGERDIDDYCEICENCDIQYGLECCKGIIAHHCKDCA